MELGCRKMQDRANHAVHTENPGHEADHQEVGPGMDRIASQGLQLSIFSGEKRKKTFF